MTADVAAHDSVTRALALDGPAREAIARDLRAAVAGDVRFDRPHRLLYATDASIYQMEPVGVVLPRDAADVQAVLRIADRHGVPVLARGAATSLAGQTVNHAIVLDCSRYMSDVIEIDAAQRRARVQPGVVVADLNRAAEPFGLQYAIDPATANRATVGGGIGNNSCGAHSLIHGKTIDHVLSLDVVLADGSAATFERVEGAALDARLALPGIEGEAYREVRRIAEEHRDQIAARYPKIMRRVSGYNLDQFLDRTSMDLSRMIVGSEGTLAVVTEATVRLVPLPRYSGLVVVHFRTLVEAAEATLVALEASPSAVELVDDTIVRRCRESAGFRDLVDFVQGDPGALLLIEFNGDSAAEIAERAAAVTSALSGNGLGYATVTVTEPAAQARVWRMRQAGLGLLMSARGDAKPLAFVEDAAVDPAQLPRFIERFDAIVRAHGTEAAYYGHASVGCLHVRPTINIKEPDGLSAMKSIAEAVADLVLEFGGSLSGEHGDGILRGGFTERMFGPRLTQAFREVKRAFDPRGVLNPGKIVDTPRFDENLRTGPGTRNIEPRTHLDFAPDGGFAGAVEQCNGQGACRKADGGMCPSFMVTREEEHSPRGRANLLRMAISGVLPPEELAGPTMMAALDLCVECKACATECPSGVDVARLKYEVLAQHHDRHGAPLRSRLFARAALLGRLGSATAPLSNALLRSAPVRRALHRLAGIHAARTLPQFARRTFRRWLAERPPPPPDAPRGEVVLLADTFTQYHYPETGESAVRVLEALGFRVRLTQAEVCCGRPAISNGLLPAAAKQASAMLSALRPFVERGLPVVGLEPSCLLTIRHEYAALVRDPALREVARMVAEHSVLLEELVASVLAADPAAAAIFDRSPKGQVLLHGHCHQKALASMEPSLSVLRTAGYEASLIDSPCCGMAGAFGYEAEHYEMSRAMGALRLFPAIEAAPEDAVVAVTGASCREQIDHFTSARPRHVAELLAGALAQPPG